MTSDLNERLALAWVKLTGTLKNTRIPQGMIYNEAIVMLIVYHRYMEDGEGLVSFKELVSSTRMLKSLVNRTIDALVQKGYLEKCDGKDKRTTFVRPLNLDEYLKVHDKTLALVNMIIQTIGEEDAEAFIRISEKIAEIDPLSEGD